MQHLPTVKQRNKHRQKEPHALKTRTYCDKNEEKMHVKTRHVTQSLRHNMPPKHSRNGLKRQLSHQLSTTHAHDTQA